MIAISSHNHISDAIQWASSHGTAEGYDVTDLEQDRIDIGWRPVAATTTVTLDVEIPVSRPTHVIAVFGALSPGALTQVTVRHSLTWPITTSSLIGTIQLDHRGDGALVLPTPQFARYWRFSFPVVAPLHVGGLWLGPRALLGRNFSRMRVERLHPSIRNELETGHESVYQLAGQRHRLSLEWGRLLELELTRLLLVVDELRGGGRPLVVVPEPARTAARPYVIHGRLDDRAGWQVDHPEYRGFGMEIRESGRGAHVW